MKESCIKIFKEFPQVKGFFSYKNAAVEGSPFNNYQLFEELGLEQTTIVWPKQIHENHVAVIDSEMVKNAEQRDRLPQMKSIVVPDTDAIITDQKNILLTTVHADCLPVFFFDHVKNVIGLAHAGWRGTAAGIVQKTILRMEEAYGCRPEHIHVYIGPGISSCCFETGPEVYEEFMEKWDFAGDFAKLKEDRKEQKYLIDIKGINERELKCVNVPPQNISIDAHCTCCEPESFCSYRREGGTYMRMGAGLCLV